MSFPWRYSGENPVARVLLEKTDISRPVPRLFLATYSPSALSSVYDASCLASVTIRHYRSSGLNEFLTQCHGNTGLVVPDELCLVPNMGGCAAR